MKAPGGPRTRRDRTADRGTFRFEVVDDDRGLSTVSEMDVTEGWRGFVFPDSEDAEGLRFPFVFEGFEFVFEFLEAS